MSDDSHEHVYRCQDCGLMQDEVNDLVVKSQDATTQPVESAQLPKDNQIDVRADIEENFMRFMSAIEGWQSMIAGSPTQNDMKDLERIYHKYSTRVLAALATAIREATPKEDKRIDDNRYGDAPHEYFVGYNHAVKQFVEAFRDLGLEV